MTPAGTDHEIYEYLLGRLQPEQAAQIDERIITDTSFFEKVEIAEETLLDQYVRNILTIEDRCAMDANFLHTPSRQQALRSAMAWKKKLDFKNSTPYPIPIPVAPIPTPINLSAVRSPRVNLYRYTTAACFMLAAFLGVAYLRAINQLQQNTAYIASLTKELQKETAYKTEVVLHGDQLFEFPLSSDAVERVAESNVKIVALTPTQLAGGMELIRLSGEIQSVQFIMKIPEDIWDQTSVRLKTDGNQLLALVSGVNPVKLGKQNMVLVKFPAKFLHTGNYRIEVIDKQARTIKNYAFGVN